MNQLNKRNTAILMYLVIALGGVVVDIIVPSLPSIQSAFSSSESLAQWVFSAAILGFGIGQIIAGFVVDAAGRKAPMLMGGVMLVMSLLVSVLSPNIYVLTFMRLMQGLAVSFLAVGGRAIIKDMYSGEAYLKAVNWITISFAMGITLSPFIGGYIQQHFGWQAVLVTLSIWVAAGCTLLMIFFTETHPNPTPFSVETARSNLREILHNPAFQQAALTSGIFYAILPSFNTLAPFLVQNTLGYSPVIYGYIALLLGACWLAGNITNRLTFSIQSEVKIRVATMVSVVANCIAIVYQWQYGLNLSALLAPVAVLIFSLGLLFPLVLGQALSPFSHIAGIANALVFSCCWICTALISFIVSYLSSESAIPLLICYALLLCLVITIRRLSWSGQQSEDRAL